MSVHALVHIPLVVHFVLRKFVVAYKYKYRPFVKYITMLYLIAEFCKVQACQFPYKTPKTLLFEKAGKNTTFKL
jgi:hypothetical protein